MSGTVIWIELTCRRSVQTKQKKKKNNKRSISVAGLTMWPTVFSVRLSNDKDKNNYECAHNGKCLLPFSTLRTSDSHSFSTYHCCDDISIQTEKLILTIFLWYVRHAFIDVVWKVRLSLFAHFWWWANKTTLHLHDFKQEKDDGIKTLHVSKIITFILYLFYWLSSSQRWICRIHIISSWQEESRTKLPWANQRFRIDISIWNNVDEFN